MLRNSMHAMPDMSEDEIREELVVMHRHLLHLAAAFGFGTNKGMQLNAAAAHVIATGAELADGVARPVNKTHSDWRMGPIA